MERWIGQFIMSPANEDTVYVASYKWGSGTNEPINGNGRGVNQLFSQRSGVSGVAPVRVIADGDEAQFPSDPIIATKLPAVPMVTSPVSSSHVTHNKIITIGRKAVMTGSTNLTASGTSSEPNNMVIIRVPSVAKAYLDEMDDEFLNGNFIENTKSPKTLHTAPNGDRIEAYFTPDDVNNINTSPYPANSDMVDVLTYHANNANESIFYMINVLSNTGVKNLINNNAGSKLVEGWVDNDNAGAKSVFQASHTMRDWNDFANDEGHHKVIIFDMDIVTFGSANHTGAAMTNASGNTENMVVAYDFRMGRKFMKEYRRSMGLIPVQDNVGQPDSFDQTVPGGVTGLSAVDVIPTSNQLQVSWTGPNNTDLSRYFIFITTGVFSQQDIGDGIDGDNDGYFDEDPPGDADGFSSGADGAGVQPNDDDADGLVDEDPWMYPEVQVKNQTAGAQVTATIQTVNAGDLLLDNKDYFIGVVAVDKHGNEGPLSIFGPVQSKPAVIGALPSAKIAFDTSASNQVGVASTLTLSVSNSPAALQGIKQVTADFSTVGNTETVSPTQTPPANWTVTKTGNTLTWSTALATAFIKAGETLQFQIAVNNALNSGPTPAVIVSVTDEQNVVTNNINGGSLTVVSAASQLPVGLSNAVSTMSALDGVNTINSFTGSERLLKSNVTVNYTLVNNADTMSAIWWDVDKNPDGPGGSATDKQVISSGSLKNFAAIIPGSTDASIKNGVQVRFLVQIDNTILDTNLGNYFKFTIDDTVTLPSGLTVVSANFTDITVGWNSIADGDFKQYDIFYSTTQPVTSKSPSITVTSQTQTSVTIPNLSLNTTYYIAIQARDNLGNVSGLSNAVSVATKQGTNVLIQNATDGKLQITQFDGSATLSDNSITISFTLDKIPAGSSDVQLWYDVGDNPDGAGGTDPFDRQVFAAGSGLQWQAVIPGSDPEVVDGAFVKFVFVIGGQLIQLSGAPYRFRVIGTVTEAPTGVALVDTTGTGFTLTWTSITMQNNFGGYRVYYATDTVTLASPFWDRDKDVNLYFASARTTTLTSLAPNTQYRLRVAGVDGLGNVGPFSNEVVGTTGSRGAVLITEVGIQESPEFIELEAVSGPVDIGSFQVTDLDGAPVQLAGSAVTLLTGRRAVIWLAAGTDETDATGDVNGNGFWDLYVPPGPALPATTDEVVLLSSAGDTVDAVVYRGSKLDNIDATDLAALTPTHWTGADSAGAVRSFTSVAYQRTPAIVRKQKAAGGLSDQNSRTDWEVATDTSPGGLNQFQSAIGVSISDTSPSGRVVTAVDLSGAERLKGGPYRLKLTLNQLPVVSNGLKFWYDTNADPDGRQSPSATDAIVTVPMVPGSRSVDTDITIPEAQHGKEIRFILVAENDPANADALDEIKMTRGGLPFRFSVDLQGVDTPSGLKIIDKTLGGFKLIWMPIPATSDFSNYILFYDTGAVTTASKSWSSANDPVLANIGATATQITGLLSNVYYNFRLAAVDKMGNLSGLSDTASETSVAPVKVNQVTASDGQNLIDNFFGAATLRAVVHTITVTFDRSVASPVMYWNTITAAPADGPGGNADSTVSLTAISSNQYSCTLPALTNDSTVYFVFNTDAGVIRNGASAFSYKVDGIAGDSLPRFKFGGYFDVGPNRNTSVAVTWEPLSPIAYPDFREYRVLYQRGDTVTPATANVWGPVKAPVLTDIRAAGTAVQNLAPNDTYAFGAVWVDKTGNVAAVSDTFQSVTINAVPFADPASDGVNVAHRLDGTEWLRKTDITVTFEFSSSPMNASTVVMKWNVGGAAGEGQSRSVAMKARPWDPLIYDGVILGASDPLIGDGSMVQYALWADGLKFDNSGVDFKFMVDAAPPVALTGVNVIDNGSSFTAVWSPTGMTDFNTYRIRYRPSTSGTWSYLDRSNKTILGNKSASNLTFPVSSTGHYYVNVATVDLAGHEAWQAADRIIKRGAALDPALTVNAMRLIKVVAGAAVPLTAKVWNMDGAGWSGQSVTFTIEGDSGVWRSNGQKTLNLITDANGMVQAELQTVSDLDRQLYEVRVTSQAVGASETTYKIFAVGDEKQKARTWVWEVHAP